jgi:hypothetical protein
MENLIKLKVGQPYPLKLTQTGEGAAAQFLLHGGNIMQILLDGISSEEVQAFKKGIIKAGFLFEKGCLLWLFKFHGKNKQPLFTFDCPFDSTLIPRDDIALHSIKNDQERLAIEIHVVDENRIIRAMRYVTLSNRMTLNFLSAVQDQLTMPRDQAVLANWMQYPPEELFKKCETEILGEP